MHDGMPCGPIQGQGQGHVVLKVKKNLPLSKAINLIRHFQWELTSDC